MLKNKKREFLYAFSIFGPNLIFTMMMAYFTSAVNPANLRKDIGLWSWSGDYTMAIVLASVFGILFTIGRVFDALIDIPLASKLDRMKNKYARIRMPIYIAALPLIGSAAALCLPLTQKQSSGLNTAWFFIMLIVFFTAYTLVQVGYYSGLSAITKDRNQRKRLSMFKSFIDTVQYALAYALTPLLLKGLSKTGITILGQPFNIMHVILMFIPFVATLLIPLIMVRKYKGADTSEVAAEAEQEEQIKKVGIVSSLKFVTTNKAFWPWMLVVFVYFTGLQLFLTMQNELISGVLHLEVQWAALLNAAAFGPVPIMLYFYNKIMKKKGIRFALQSSILSFAIGIVCFSVGSAVFFPNSIIPRIVINAIGGTISSFSIGAFFMMMLMVPSQVAAVEIKVAKRRNSAMYFAGQGIVVGLAGAIATGFLADTVLRGWVKKTITTASSIAKDENGVLTGSYNTPLGAFIVPFIVALLCLVAFGIAFLMPKSYDAKTIGKLFDKNYVPDKEDLADQEIDKAKVMEPAENEA